MIKLYNFEVSYKNSGANIEEMVILKETSKTYVATGIYGAMTIKKSGLPYAWQGGGLVAENLEDGKKEWNRHHEMRILELKREIEKIDNRKIIE